MATNLGLETSKFDAFDGGSFEHSEDLTTTFIQTTDFADDAAADTGIVGETSESARAAGGASLLAEAAADATHDLETDHAGSADILIVPNAEATYTDPCEPFDNFEVLPEESEALYAGKRHYFAKDVLRSGAGIFADDAQHDEDVEAYREAEQKIRQGKRWRDRKLDRKLNKVNKKLSKIQVADYKAKKRAIENKEYATSQGQAKWSEKRSKHRASKKLRLEKKRVHLLKLRGMNFNFLARGATALLPLIGVVILGFLLIAIVASVFANAANEEMAGQSGMTENELYVATYLKSKGLDILHIAAIMGNIEAESGFDPSLVEAGAGYGHGLCQWSFGRWDNLQAYAAARNKPWDDIGTQCDFLWMEYAEGGRFSALQQNRFESIGDLQEAVYYFGRIFEAPNEAYAHWDRRISSALRYAALLALESGGGNSTIVTAAISQIGVDYVWGASNPGVGMDCSGLVLYAYGEAGVVISRTTYTQIKQCRIISEAEAAPGDLIFMKFSAPGVPEHVGIYIGNGQMVHAPTFGSKVRIDNAGWSYSDAVFARFIG